MPSLVPSVLAPDALGTGAQPVVTAGGLVLRPWGAEHIEALLAAYDDPDIRRWHVGWLDRTEAEEYPTVWAEHYRAGRRVGWAVERDAALVGRVALNAGRLADADAAIAYWVMPAARGTGVAPTAVEATAAWAFGLGFHRLELTHSTANPASCRVADKCGFRLEGIKRQQGLHDDGWHDMHLHARLADDG